MIKWAAFAAATTAHLFLNGGPLRSRELWLDEASTFWIATQPLLSIPRITVETHAQPPLFYLVAHFITMVGESEWVLRSISWLLCLAIVAFVLFALQDLSLFERCLLSLIVVVHPITHFLAAEFRPYALAALTTFVASIMFLRLCERPGKRAAVWYVATAVACLYSLAFAVWTFVAHVLWAAGRLIAATRRVGVRAALKQEQMVIGAVALAGMLFLPFTIPAARWLSGGARVSIGLALSNLFDPRHYLAAIGGIAGGFVWLALLATVVVGYGLYRAYRSGERTVAFWLLVVVGQVGFVHAFIAGRADFSTRYLTPVFVSVCLLLILALRQLWPGPSRLKTPWLPVGALVLVAVLCVPYFTRSLQAAPSRTRWRQLAAEIAAMPGQKVVFTEGVWQGIVLEYYVKDLPAIAVQMNRGGRTDVLGSPMTASDLSAALTRTSGADCYFMSADLPESGLFQNVFKPSVHAAGYREVYHLRSSSGPDDFDMYGYCR